MAKSWKSTERYQVKDRHWHIEHHFEKRQQNLNSKYLILRRKQICHVSERLPQAKSAFGSYITFIELRFKKKTIIPAWILFESISHNVRNVDSTGNEDVCVKKKNEVVEWSQSEFEINWRNEGSKPNESMDVEHDPSFASTSCGVSVIEFQPKEGLAKIENTKKNRTRYNWEEVQKWRRTCRLRRMNWELSEMLMTQHLFVYSMHQPGQKDPIGETREVPWCFLKREWWEPFVNLP